LDKTESRRAKLHDVFCSLLGIGEDAYFEDAHEKLGFHALAKLGDDIRKAVNIISSSVSSVSNGQKCFSRR